MVNRQLKKAERLESMLKPYRVLDLADEKGFVCGKVLADLGADVIKIEKPGGDPSRNIGPFYKDEIDPEKSLFWFAHNTNKRGISLNLETVDGRQIFQKLVETADLVVESYPIGYMDNLGLGYRNLSQINPRIIMASVTPFGQVGPYKNYKGSDIVIQAMSGALSMAGDVDRPPVWFGGPQAFLFAGLEAAIGFVMALNYRRATGEGQYIDISMQRSMLITAYDALFWWNSNKVIKQREGSIAIRPTTGVHSRRIWPCKDGYIYLILFGGSVQDVAMKKCIQWIEDEGNPTEQLKRVNWKTLDWSKVTQAEVDSFEKPFQEFFVHKTMMELYSKLGVEFQIMMGPLYTAKEVLEDKQLIARNFWEEVEHDNLGASITYPGAWIKSNMTALESLRRAPTIGEHNQDIYGKEMGFSRRKMVTLKANGVI